MSAVISTVLLYLARHEAQFTALQLMRSVYHTATSNLSAEHSRPCMSAKGIYDALRYVCIVPNTALPSCYLCGVQLRLKASPIWTWPSLWPYVQPDRKSTSMPLTMTPYTPNMCLGCVRSRVKLITLSQACKRYTISVPDCLKRLEWKIKYKSKVLVAPEQSVAKLAKHYVNLILPFAMYPVPHTLVYSPPFYNPFIHQNVQVYPSILRAVSLRHLKTFRKRNASSTRRVPWPFGELVGNVYLAINHIDQVNIDSTESAFLPYTLWFIHQQHALGFY